MNGTPVNGTPANGTAHTRALIGYGRAWLPLIAVCNLTATAAALVLPLLLGRAIDAIVLGRDAASWSALSGGAIGLAVLCEMLDSILRTGCVAGTTARLRRGMVRHVLAAGPQHARRFDSGDLVSRVAGNAAGAAQAGPALIGAVVAVLPSVGSLAGLAWIDPWLSATFLAGLGLVGLVLRAFTRHTADVVNAYLAVQSRIAARLLEALAGGRTIAAAGTAAAERDRVLRALPELHAQGRQTWQVLSRSTAQGTALGPLVLVIVLAVGGLELLRGRISAGELFAAAQYASIGMGLGMLTGVLGLVARSRASTARVSEVLDLPVVHYGQRRLPPGPGVLEFQDVSVHSAEATLLSGVNLVVPGGAAVAVVGDSGAGKSVLAAVACRLHDPDTGQVLLDGVPLSALHHDTLRAEVGCAFERPVLVGRSVGEAITAEHGTERARGLAAATHAHEVIRTLPHGYHTPLGDAPMSGGEIQRIGLARAWSAGRLLVLDDATSSLDTITEMRIGRTLSAEKGRTRLIVTHRASTAARADLVLWLEGGRVRGMAPHAELCRQEKYRQVFG